MAHRYLNVLKIWPILLPNILNLQVQLSQRWDKVYINNLKVKKQRCKFPSTFQCVGETDRIAEQIFKSIVLTDSVEKHLMFEFKTVLTPKSQQLL